MVRFLFLLFILMSLSLQASETSCKRGKSLSDEINEKPMKDSAEPWVVQHDRDRGNQIRILENGLASLYSRIDLIRRAQKKIEIEYFIFKIIGRNLTGATTSVAKMIGKKVSKKQKVVNVSSIILLHELAKKIVFDKVQVRILLDYTANDFNRNSILAFQLYMKKLAEKNSQKLDLNLLHIKYYNSTLKALSINYRNHRKLLAVDDKYAITGGRNLEDKYFDLDPKNNFLDRDVLVKGPIVKEGMVASFNKYWESPVNSRSITFLEAHIPHPQPKGATSKRVELSRKRTRVRVREEGMFRPTDVHLGFKKKKVEKYSKLLNEDYSQVLQKIMTQGKSTYNIESDFQSCGKISFVSDRALRRKTILVGPGPLHTALDFVGLSRSYRNRYRFHDRAIFEVSERASYKRNNSVLISSPYFSMNCRHKKIYEHILNKKNKAGKKLDLILFTNSLASAEASYNVSFHYHRFEEFLETGLEMHLHNSRDLNDKTSMEPEKRYNPFWSLHSKSHVYGDDAIYIGSYNIDNRSSYYNTEMGIFCEKSPEVADKLRALIDHRIDNLGINIFPGKVGINNKDNTEISIYGPGVTEKQIRFMHRIYPIINQFERYF